jgi:DMSO reductase anchor subunit
MHPAFSVIFFTTASGAGYGLLALLGIFAAAGLLPATTWLGFFGLAIALGLIGSGLLSSMLHLGHPERFVKALTQWRSSWLAREGVIAIATFVPAGLFAIGWVFLNRNSGAFGWLGAASAAMAALTVFCTSMIYASLKPIRQWHNGLVPFSYLALAAYTGALLFVAITGLFGAGSTVYVLLTLVLGIIAWIVKTAYWRSIDRSRPRSDLGTATGLGRFGEVRLLEQPHTEANFIMREMGFQIARKHAAKLRMIVHAALFAGPVVLLAILLIGQLPAAVAAGIAVLAVIAGGIGVVTERWLFFAEATHASMIYYGREM